MNDEIKTLEASLKNIKAQIDSFTVLARATDEAFYWEQIHQLHSQWSRVQGRIFLLNYNSISK